MEPMELDDDYSPDHASPQYFPPAQRQTFPVSHSSHLGHHYAPGVTHTASGTTSTFSPTRAFAARTPQRSASVSDLHNHSGHPLHYTGNASYTGWRDSCSANPMFSQVRTGELQSVRASVDSSEDRDVTLPLEEGEASWMETSDLSENWGKGVVHNTEPKSEQGTAVEAVPQRGLQGEAMKAQNIRTKRVKSLPAVPMSRRCTKRLVVSVVSLLVIAAAVVLPSLLQEQRTSLASVDTELLRKEMASRVFGQHIAVDVVPRRIEQYLATLRQKKDLENNSVCIIPPLVLSFHGWTGGGKSFVSNIIIQVFPAWNVKILYISQHYPLQHLDERYKNEVENWILSNVRDYSVSLFVLDDMDNATPGVTQGIHNAFTKLQQENSCHSPVVFLLLSQAFGVDINRQVFEAMENNVDREQLSIENFSSLFDDCGDKSSWYQLLRSEITVTVPFLPLERRHVAQCVHQNLVSKELSMRHDFVRHVLQELQFFRLSNGQEFSSTGCKRVCDKVNYVAYGHGELDVIVSV